MSPEPSCHKNIPGYRNLVTNIGDKFSRRHTKKLGPSAVLMRAGTSLITIFLVTLSFRNLQPLIKSLGLLDSPDRPKRLRCHQHPYGGRRKSRSIYHAPKKTGWINAGEETRKILAEPDKISAFRSYT